MSDEKTRKNLRHPSRESAPLPRTVRYDVAAELTGTRTPGFYDEHREHVLLKVIDGPLRGTAFVMPHGACILGREQSCDHCVMDSTVSRQHCRFDLDETGLTVEDLGSYHGVLVNGRRLDYARLQPLTIVELGDLMMQVEIVPKHALPTYAHVLFPREQGR